MAARIVSLIAAAVLAGCASPAPDPLVIREPVEIRVPVPVRAEPPAELATPYQPAVLPEFVSPAREDAAAALTPEGLARLRVLLRELVTREQAWRAWAADPIPSPPP